jgi:hypothetical protein
MATSKYLDRDPRLEEGTALRDLEKKIHFLLAAMGSAGMLQENVDLSDEVYADFSEIQNSLYG